MSLRLVRTRADPVLPRGTVALSCARHEIAEWTFCAGRSYEDPFNDVALDAIVTSPQGRQVCVPAFWAGGDTWRVRFSPDEMGEYTLTTNCSSPNDAGLHGRPGKLDVTEYEGDNPLLRHGPLRWRGDHLAHADGHPFLWLGDTWWLGLTKRFAWPATFQTLVADRKHKGFSVIQVLGGLACDMAQHDPRGANEGGLAWEPGYARINPAFFDWADLRIDWLVTEGLAPCLFGAWSFYLQWMGVDRIKQHWRYLIARYGAYPVVWCLAGGGTMPFYTSTTKSKDREALRVGWSEVAEYVASLDPYPRPMALHRSPRQANSGELGADVPHDLAMRAVGRWVATRAAQRSAPDIRGEVCFPGMLTVERHDLHRRAFWQGMLSGACGFTYGVSGLWQAGSVEDPYGPSPNGHVWPNTPWREAMVLDSSDQVGLAKRLLEAYRWWEFDAHPEWIVGHDDGEGLGPVAAGIPGRVRVVYLPEATANRMRIAELEPETTYRARWVSPRDGREIGLGAVTGATVWAAPPPPDDGDWLLILENITS